MTDLIRIQRVSSYQQTTLYIHSKQTDHVQIYAFILLNCLDMDQVRHCDGTDPGPESFQLSADNTIYT